MRYLVTFLRVCGLVLIAFIGCFGGGEEEGCESYELPPLCLFPPCAEPDPCEGVVCPPDDNECTREFCSGGSCTSEPVTNGRSCTYDSLSGVCVEGVCGENLCEDVVCDDGDACTEGTCDYVDGTCDFAPKVCDDHEECTEDTCDPAVGCVFTAVEDGTTCGPPGWICIGGNCVPAECERPEDCDDGNQCTEDTCDPLDRCVFTAVEDGTECGGRFGICEAGSCVAPCDLTSDEEYQCPIIGLEDLFCCPGSENCRDDCTVPECLTHADCDDDDVCTHDRCDYVDGTCDTPVVACDDHDPCTADACDPVDGCMFRAIEDCCRDLCWVTQNSGTTNDLNDVSFTDANNGTVVGRDGTILRTTDGGATWVAQNSGTTNSLLGVSFTDTNNGTAVGGISFVGGASYGIILRTTDEGATWVEQGSGTSKLLLFDVAFTDGNNGTAVGKKGTILRTTDGGATWTAQNSGTTNDLGGVAFTDVDTGTAVGSNGTILRTTDGGATWVAQNSGTTNSLLGVSFTDTNTGTAVSWATTPTIFRTTDGGATWVKQDAPRGTDQFYDVSFTDANTGTIVGVHHILRTRDGGATWWLQHRQEWMGLSGVSFTDANTGTAVGDNGTILRRTDGGGG